jgi:hypothetical protein
MEQREERINPRPEARPLGFDELTEEQREAGEKVSSLLRGMAQDPWKRPPASKAQAHSYLPSFDDNRRNRVVLLDGARGSGKSALLITLLNAYGRALTEQQTPDGFQEWIRPADRVVPVGLIDLQPLPSSTHLLLHLVASMERVVEAMESRHEQTRLGAAAWHPSNENELPSRRCWRTFARVTASGWVNNLAERQGQLDPEAFAVELEQGELQRLDVIAAFRDFVDALVGDYQAWNHWQSGLPPLFLLAIDDADMNMDLSGVLLELIRKLWHPRLAFLITGDTELFIGKATAARPVAYPFRSIRAPVNFSFESYDDRRQRQLRLDVYSKVIPQLHRCRLAELTLRQRLVAGPGLRGIFESLRPAAGSLPAGQPGSSLLSYFTHDPQIQEVLPGRLRALWELAASLRPMLSLPEGMALIEAVALLWRQAVEIAPLTPSLRERLESMVWVDPATGVLRVEKGFILEFQVDFVSELQVDGQPSLIIERPSRLHAFMDRRGENELPPPLTAALMLALDLIVDSSGIRLGGPAALPWTLVPPVLAHASLSELLPQGPIAWPVPNWGSPLRFAMLKREWEAASGFLNSPDANAAEAAARYFLKAVLNVGEGGAPAVEPESQRAPDSWAALATRIAKAASGNGAGSRRDQALSEWSIARAGLLAAPESGLPARAANALLRALIKAFGSMWGNVKLALYVARREHIIKARSRENNNPYLRQDDLDTFIQRLDESFPKHEFRKLVEAQEPKAPIGHEEVFTSLRGTLERIKLPSLKRMVGTGMSNLQAYLTPRRKQWLEKAPREFLVRTREALEPFSRIHDAGAAALVKFWQEGCAESGRNDWLEALRLVGGKLHIAEEQLIRLNAAKQPQEVPGKTLSVQMETGLFVSIDVLQGARTPVLPKARTRPSVRGLEAILRMAHDFQMDHQPEPLPEDPRAWWRGIRARLGSGPFFCPWPVPAWPTLFEWEILEKEWLKAMDLARKLTHAETHQPDARLLDALAYCLISVCHSLETREVVAWELQLDPPPASWRRLIREVLSRHIVKEEARANVYKQWKVRTALMAAPESGLSVTAASAILAGLRNPSEEERKEELAQVSFEEIFKELARQAVIKELGVGSQANGTTTVEENEATIRAHMQRMRRERLLDAGLLPAQVDGLLQDIDARFPEHPWVKAFGSSKAAEEAPST